MLAAEIDAAHCAARVAAEVHFDEARRAGRLLIEAKALVAHGEWSKWLTKNFTGSARTARLYMQLAREPEPEIGNVADLSIRSAVREATRRREGLRKEAGPKPGEHLRASWGPYPDLPVQEASRAIRAKAGLSSLPPSRRYTARVELDETGPFPPAGTEWTISLEYADGDGGKKRHRITEDDTADPAAAIRETINWAKKGSPDGRR